MPAPLIGAVAAPLVGAAAGRLFGPKQQTAQAAVPADLSGLRQNQIQLLNFLTNIGNPTSLGPRTAGPGGQPGAGGPTIQPPSAGGAVPFFGGEVNQSGGLPALPSFTGTGGGGVLADRVNQVFGPLGVQQNPLQNTAANAANRMLTQQSPEQRALEAAQPHLTQTGLNPGATNRLQQGATQSGLNPASQNFFTQLLGGAPSLGPGQNVQDLLGQFAQTGGFSAAGPLGGLQQLLAQTAAGQGLPGAGAGNEQFLQGVLGQNPAQANFNLLQPSFERALAMANQQGGRFGSANAILRSNAVTDNQAQLFNALQQGTGQQLQAAGLLGQQAQANRAAELQARLQALGIGSGLLGQQAGNRLGATNALGGFNQQGALAGFQGQLQGAGTLGAQGLQDIAQQLQAAGVLGQQGLAGQGNILQGLGLGGQLAGQAGGADRANVGQAFGIGSALAGQDDVETQRRLQILMSMIGQAQGAAFNQPTTVTPTGAQQGAAIGGQIGNILASSLPFLLGRGQGGGGQGGSR